MKTAIFCLTRGYHQKERYNSLIERNKSIEKYIGTESDIILFEEGNVHREYIESQTPNLRIQWIVIPFQFPRDISLPAETLKTFYDGSCYPGYHLMCEFHTCHVWNYLKDYDVVLRVDEDCILTSDTWKNVFTTVNSDIPYRSPLFVENETHEMTIATLPKWLGEEFYETYDKKMPYTNVYVTYMEMWKRPDIRNWLDQVKAVGGCLKYRWGDHILHGIVLKKFGIGHGTMPGYTYYHGSHDCHVTSE